VANLSKTLHTNLYQNRSTFAEVMHKSILVCFFAPQCIFLCAMYVYQNVSVVCSHRSLSAYCLKPAAGHRPCTKTVYLSMSSFLCASYIPRVPPGRGKSWNLGKPFYWPGKS